MLKKPTLALTASLLLSAQAKVEETKQPPTAPPLDGCLFDSTASWIAPVSGAALARGI